MGELETALWTVFIPALFGGSSPDDMREILAHSVKGGGLGLLDPTNAATTSYEVSTECCGELVESLLHRMELNYAAHWLCVRMGSWAARSARQQREEGAVRKKMGEGSLVGKHKLMRSLETGAWLM
eukprot:14062450-Ditylum_brightwellii.AAC.1